LSQPLVSIVIVNWNGKHHLEHCLPSVLKQTYVNYEVILVDNGSNDGSVEYVRRKYPAILVITNNQNLGFPKAANIGIKAAKGEYVVTLNNDTVADTHWLTELVKAAETSKKVGMVASKMVRLFQQKVIDSAGVLMDKSGAAYDRGSGEQDLGQFGSLAEVFAPCGGAALWRREMLKDIGLFDEDYFAYYEDVDLSFRARLAGWQCIYAAKAVAYHVHSASSGGAGSAFKYYMLARNRLWTIAKNLSIRQMIIYSPVIIVYTALMLAYDLVINHRLAAVRGAFDAIRGIPRILKKRRDIHQKRQISYSEIDRLLQWPKNPLSILRSARRREKWSKMGESM